MADQPMYIRSLGGDTTTEIIQAIEKVRFGKSSIWMSVGQGNILHTEEYDLMNLMMNLILPLLG